MIVITEVWMMDPSDITVETIAEKAGPASKRPVAEYYIDSIELVMGAYAKGYRLVTVPGGMTGIFDELKSASLAAALKFMQSDDADTAERELHITSAASMLLGREKRQWLTDEVLAADLMYVIDCCGLRTGMVYVRIPESELAVRGYLVDKDPERTVIDMDYSPIGLSTRNMVEVLISSRESESFDAESLIEAYVEDLQSLVGRKKK